MVPDDFLGDLNAGDASRRTIGFLEIDDTKGFEPRAYRFSGVVATGDVASPMETIRLVFFLIKAFVDFHPKASTV